MSNEKVKLTIEVGADGKYQPIIWIADFPPIYSPKCSNLLLAMAEAGETLVQATRLVTAMRILNDLETEEMATDEVKKILAKPQNS